MRPKWVWRKFLQGTVWAERSGLSNNTTSTTNTSLDRSGCSHLDLARVSVAEWTSQECQSGVRMLLGLSSIFRDLDQCAVITAAPQMCVMQPQGDTYKRSNATLFTVLCTDESYRCPPRWQKSLKQQRGLIFSNGMQCTVNKRAERADEETAESAVDSEMRWPFRGAGWKVRALSKHRGGSA